MNHAFDEKQKTESQMKRREEDLLNVELDDWLIDRTVDWSVEFVDFRVHVTAVCDTHVQIDEIR